MVRIPEPKTRPAWSSESALWRWMLPLWPSGMVQRIEARGQLGVPDIWFGGVRLPDDDVPRTGWLELKLASGIEAARLPTMRPDQAAWLNRARRAGVHAGVLAGADDGGLSLYTDLDFRYLLGAVDRSTASWTGRKVDRSIVGMIAVLTAIRGPS